MARQQEAWPPPPANTKSSSASAWPAAAEGYGSGATTPVPWSTSTAKAPPATNVTPAAAAAAAAAAVAPAAPAEKKVAIGFEGINFAGFGLGLRAAMPKMPSFRVCPEILRQLLASRFPNFVSSYFILIRLLNFSLKKQNKL